MSIKREMLNVFEGRIKGKALISRRGISKPDEKDTILLTNIILTDGKQTAEVDHAWFILGKRLDKQKPLLKPNKIVYFTCEVQPEICKETNEIIAYHLKKLRVKKVQKVINA